MFSFRWIEPEALPLVVAARLDDLPGAMKRQDGQRVSDGHGGRETQRICVEMPTGASQTIFLKRESKPLLKDLAAHAARGNGWWTKCRAEFEVLRHLRRHGVWVPRPLVCLQSAGLRPQSCLVLAALTSAEPLTEYLLAGKLNGDEATRRHFFGTLGAEVAHLHAAGADHPDLYTSHVFVAGKADSPRFAFIDLQRSKLRKDVPLEERIRDLAALVATLSPRMTGCEDRDYLVEAYLDAARIRYRDVFWRLLLSRVEHLLSRRKVWEIREADTPEHRAVRQLHGSAREGLWMDQRWQPQLRQAGLDNFEAMMNVQQGDLMRALSDRENWRLQLHTPDGTDRTAYLKKHHFRTLGTRVRAKLGVGPSPTPGRVEARNAIRLHRGGIAAMPLIAFGERLHPDGRLESFLLTEELSGYEQLDHFLRGNFPELNRHATAHDERLDALVSSVAEVAGKFHRLGYNHRDLYCCHFFIREPVPGQFQVNLIDLQRVEHRTRWRQRWIVKDLAQLAYSAPRERISRTQRLRFMKRYLGVQHLRPEHKRLIRSVLAKQARMERHEGLHP